MLLHDAFNQAGLVVFGYRAKHDPVDQHQPFNSWITKLLKSTYNQRVGRSEDYLTVTYFEGVHNLIFIQVILVAIFNALYTSLIIRSALCEQTNRVM